ncbi:protein particle complex subunit 5 [Seminavis robusta]|uniref:Trafficking protein particle complex subunit n=1 Tax=Seminavis robusta TaxID=568900 RepID=A0A9N8DWL6_9STRA|nr:protein particle complex subunit 5 [Seminavis robusta]|eukprot:Sro335_g120180.1 protein particle complex subunit 5 (266) ;mRNA; r:59513-60595
MNRSPANILDRPIGGRGSRSSPEVSASAFAYVYSELVQYHQNRVDSISELERRLESSGYGVGLKVLELLAYRSREFKRETRLMNVLQFVSSQCWKALFHKPADSLERSIDHADEYMIVDYTPITSTYIRVGSDMGSLSVDAYISGIIAGILAGAGFPARVTAHSVALEEVEKTDQAQREQAAFFGTTRGGTVRDGSSVRGAVSDAVGSAVMGMGSERGGPAGNTMSIAAAAAAVPLPPIPARTEKAVFLVKFSPEVLTRDAAMDR